LTFSADLLTLFLFVLAVCLIGFKKYVWFISIGYWLSIAVVSAGLLLLCGYKMDTVAILYCIVMLCYSLRLGGLLLLRESKNSHRAHIKDNASDGSKTPLGVKIALWLSCAILYIFMIAPLIYRCSAGGKSNAFAVIGLVISLGGVILEAVADGQKSKAKRINRHTFCSSGVFKLVRCPNYLGQLLIWTGIILSGFGVLHSAGQWILALIGYLGIVYVTFSNARRLEISQDKNYGLDPAYRKYKKTTPILLPFVPLYSVKKHKWLVG